MQTINIEGIQLTRIYNAIDNCCFSSEELGDLAHQVTNFHTSYEDESSLSFFTYQIKTQEADLEVVTEMLADYLPSKEAQEAFTKDNHVILKSRIETLAIHFNDSTITVIYHCTGEI